MFHPPDDPGHTDQSRLKRAAQIHFHAPEYTKKQQEVHTLHTREHPARNPTKLMNTSHLHLFCLSKPSFPSHPELTPEPHPKTVPSPPQPLVNPRATSTSSVVPSALPP